MRFTRVCRSNANAALHVVIRYLYVRLGKNWRKMSQKNMLERPNQQTPKPKKPKKPNFNCHKCGKPGHFAKDCRVNIPRRNERSSTEPRKEFKRKALNETASSEEEYDVFHQYLCLSSVSTVQRTITCMG